MGIVKTEVARTTGDNSTVAQAFIRNLVTDIEEQSITPSVFRVPLAGVTGATFDFYSQNTKPISTNLNNSKTVKLNFSANSESLSGTTQLIHDLYRLDVGEFLSTKENIEAGATGDTGIETIEEKLSTPFVTIEENASGLTTFTPHTLTIPATVKPEGQFSVSTFEDKSQYFIDTRFEFDRENDLTVGDRLVFSGESIGGDNEFVPVEQPTQEFERVTTQKRSTEITGGTFSGTVINGAFFVYFEAPNKPDIDVVNDKPTAVGSLPTFSPTFSFNNVEDGDFYKLQVSYDVNNESFSGDNVPIFTIPFQEGDTDFIRTFTTPLNPNSQFLYRIGNTKQLENIFGIKHSVTTWSRTETALTANDGTFDIEGTVYLNTISSASTLSGATVRLELQQTTSSVDFGADSPLNEEIDEEVTSSLDTNVGTVFSTTTSSGGTFSFPDSVGGTYDFTVSHPDLPTESFTIVVSENVNLSIVLDLLWGNDVFTFNDVGDITFV